MTWTTFCAVESWTDLDTMCLSRNTKTERQEDGRRQKKTQKGKNTRIRTFAYYGDFRGFLVFFLAKRKKAKRKKRNAKRKKAKRRKERRHSNLRLLW